MFVHIPLMTETTVSYNPGIPTFEGNFVSCVQDDGSRNMSSALVS